MPHQGDYKIKGKVKLSLNGQKTTIETIGDESVTLMHNSKKIISATFANRGGHNNKVIFNEPSSGSLYTVKFSGHYQDKDKDYFNSESKEYFVYDTSASNKFIHKNEKATLKGKEDTPSWTWNVNNGISVSKNL